MMVSVIHNLYLKQLNRILLTFTHFSEFLLRLGGKMESYGNPYFPNCRWWLVYSIWQSVTLCYIQNARERSMCLTAILVLASMHVMGLDLGCFLLPSSPTSGIRLMCSLMMWVDAGLATVSECCSVSGWLFPWASVARYCCSPLVSCWFSTTSASLWRVSAARSKYARLYLFQKLSSFM